MSSALKKLRNLTKKDKGRSNPSSPAPGVSHPSTSQIPTINLDLVTTPITERANNSSGETKRVCIEAGITTLKHLKEISEANGVLSPLKAACGATTAILETIVAMDSNKEAWKDTLQTIRRHRGIFDRQLASMSTQSTVPIADLGLLDPIKAYGRELESILGALMLENGISTQEIPQGSMFQSLGTFMKRYGTVKVEAEKISGYVDQLDAAMKELTISLAMYTGMKLHSAEQRLVTIDAKLPVTNPDVVAVEIKLKPRPRLVANFMGREDILEAMQNDHFHNHLAQTQSQVITILSGIGGLGKTQMALKFALEFEQRHPGVPIYFLDASAPDKLQTDLEILIRSRGMAYHAKLYEDTLVWLATELKNWLVILDNADDPNIDPVQYIPQCAHGHVIITTRNATLAALAPHTSHALDGLPMNDAIILLLRASKYPDIQENREWAEKIARELGYLPLALSHAAEYIFVHRCLGSYLDMYHKNRERTLSSTNSRLLHNYQSSVTTTIKMSVDKLSERARGVIRLFSHLQATSISHSIVVKAAECKFRHVVRTGASSMNPETLKQADALEKVFCPDGEWSELDFNEVIRECLQYSLLQVTSKNDAKFYSMHVLVQSYLQGSGLIHNHQPKRLVCRLLGSAITIGKRYEFLAFNRFLLPHIRLIQIEDVTEAGDHYALGNVLNELGDARLAVVHQEKCVEIWRESLGKEDEHTTGAMADLVLSHQYAGNIRAAVDLGEEVLSVRKRVVGPEHPDIIVSMSNLAHSYRAVGKIQAALELDEEVLSLQKRTLGPEHPDTIVSMSNLALSYNNAGRSQLALELNEEVLSLRKRILGPKHPDTIHSMSNLVDYYRMAGKNEAALELAEQVWSLRNKILGPEHPNTIVAMSNLALCYKTMGINQAALELEEQVLLFRQKIFGPEHPDTMLAMTNLGFSYAKLGNNEAALKLQEEVLSLYKRVCGSEHPDTALAMRDLAVTYMGVGKYEAALGLLEEALPLLTKLLGVRHPSTLTTMQNLLTTYQELKMEVERVKLLKVAVAAHEAAESYGIDDPFTVKLRDELIELSTPIINEGDRVSNSTSVSPETTASI